MPMWAELDGDVIKVNTAYGRQKCTNMLKRPKVSVLAIDPDDGHRFLEVRGRAEVSDEDANAHADKLITKYRGPECIPTEPREETRVVFRIIPEWVHAIG
jgi:PPOX class probable F420-dependent enzyme